jgi:hypothetical protein
MRYLCELLALYAPGLYSLIPCLQLSMKDHHISDLPAEKDHNEMQAVLGNIATKLNSLCNHIKNAMSISVLS